MSEMPDLNRILDEALSGYCATEPPPGLQRRVLARVRAGRRTSRLTWWTAVPAVAALSLAFLLLRAPDAPSPRPVRVHNNPPRSIATAPRPASAPARTARGEAVRRQQAVSVPARFPAPAPLSTEERLLVDLQSRRPAEVWPLLAGTNASLEPVSIDEIRIEPLPVEN